MANPWIAALVALFAWWFSTGAILAVVNRADAGGSRSHLWAVLLSVPVLFLGAALFLDTVARTEVGAVYAGFFAALMIWGWIEMAFLCGVIMGPNRYPTPDGTDGWERFVRAWGAVAYHEVLLATAVVLIGMAAWNMANPFGFYTFAVLFFARISAKLNLFLGVPKINTEFLPEPLSHLPSHFRYRRMNWLLPISLAVLSATLWCFVDRINASTDPAARAGFALIAAMTALALLEHVLMVTRLPDEKLWRWMLPDQAARPDPKKTPQGGTS